MEGTGTKLTIENCYGKYTVESSGDDLNIQEHFDNLIIPCLLAAGFNREVIATYLEEK